MKTQSLRPEPSSSGPILEGRRTENGEESLREKDERERHQAFQSEANVFWAMILLIFKLQGVEQI
jgi:hypothetical protein